MPEPKRAKPKRAKTVRAWCVVDGDGKLCVATAGIAKGYVARFAGIGRRIARVEIREVTK